MSEGVGRNRIAAVVEVTLAFVAMHIGFRLIKRHTAFGHWEMSEGMNFSPGLMMIVISLGGLLLVKSRLKAAPASDRSISTSLEAGFIGLMVVATLGLLLMKSGVKVRDVKTAWSIALIMSAASVVATIVLARLLSKVPLVPSRRRKNIIVVLGAVFLVLLIGRFWDYFTEHLLTVAWLLVGSALGEELFFRGYMQTRLNEAFGRSWSLFGIAWGPGLLLASAFFGLVHVLNPYDYINGQGTFAWPHGLATFAALHFGLLREKTGGITACVLLHFLVNFSGRALQF